VSPLVRALVAAVRWGHRTKAEALLKVQVEGTYHDVLDYKRALNIPR
jgi:hypothetical protein